MISRPVRTLRWLPMDDGTHALVDDLTAEQLGEVVPNAHGETTTFIGHVGANQDLPAVAPSKPPQKERVRPQAAQATRYG